MVTQSLCYPGFIGLVVHAVITDVQTTKTISLEDSIPHKQFPFDSASLRFYS